MKPTINIIIPDFNCGRTKKNRFGRYYCNLCGWMVHPLNKKCKTCYNDLTKTERT